MQETPNCNYGFVYVQQGEVEGEEQKNKRIDARDASTMR